MARHHYNVFAKSLTQEKCMVVTRKFAVAPILPVDIMGVFVLLPEED